MAKLMNFRMWIVVIALLLSIVAINPSPWASGVEITSVEKGSLEAETGMAAGQLIQRINEQPINTLQDYYDAIKPFAKEPQLVTVETSTGKFSYNITDDLGFEVDENLTVISSEKFSPIEKEWEIKSINNKGLNSTEDFEKISDELLPKQILKIRTNKGESAFLARGKPKIMVSEATQTNLKKGLELAGGTRVLLKPISGEEVTDKNIEDLIKVMDNRLNVYGLTDIKIRSAKDWQGNKFVVIELAGVTKEEVEELIAQQGKFEAKIGNETVFIGGNKDIPFVCRNDGSCSGIRECNPVGDNQWMCKFEFVIHLSAAAAKKHAQVTDKLGIETAEDGRQILSKRIDFFLDGKNVDSLQISSDLKGAEATAIAISGPGVAQTKVGAVDAAVQNMDRLQTILITGSLPFDIEIVKLDSISPTLGSEFVKNAIITGLIAMLAVIIIIILRYRVIKIIIPVMITSIIEIIMTLGVAAFIQWNLDLASIAGIIAAVGTGVNDQIIIIDEALRGSEERAYTWKQKIKRAFSIIFIAYAAIIAAMLPLWNAGAGLLRGFAVTTIIGVTIGVFITRPAFARLVEKILKE